MPRIDSATLADLEDAALGLGFDGVMPSELDDFDGFLRNSREVHGFVVQQDFDLVLHAGEELCGKCHTVLPACGRCDCEDEP